MKGLRRLASKLRFLMWGALVFALFSYVARPLRSAFWTPREAPGVCRALLAGQAVSDAWGQPFVLDGSSHTARSAGVDRQLGTGDDVIYPCD